MKILLLLSCLMLSTMTLARGSFFACQDDENDFITIEIPNDERCWRSATIQVLTGSNTWMNKARECELTKEHLFLGSECGGNSCPPPIVILKRIKNNEWKGRINMIGSVKCKHYVNLEKN